MNMCSGSNTNKTGSHVKTPDCLAGKSVKVGFFDSGMGGITVVREFLKLHPNADVYYVADWEWCPYGNKPEDVVFKRCCHITEKLIAYGCKMIVVACNTATAVAIEHLRKTYAIPFVGMEPAVKPAALKTKTGVIGVIATPWTLNGRLFRATSAQFSNTVKIIPIAGEGLVELVENNSSGGVFAADRHSGTNVDDHALEVVKKIIQPLLEQNADCIVLGCTHYPLLRDVFEKATEGTGNDVAIIDSSEAVAKRASYILGTIGGS